MGDISDGFDTISDNFTFDKLIQAVTDPAANLIDFTAVFADQTDSSWYTNWKSTDFFNNATKQANSNAWDVINGDRGATEAPDSWFGKGDLAGVLDNFMGAEGYQEPDDKDTTFDNAIKAGYAATRSTSSSSNDSLVDDGDDDDDNWFSSLLG